MRCRHSGARKDLLCEFGRNCASYYYQHLRGVKYLGQRAPAQGPALLVCGM